MEHLVRFFSAEGREGQHTAENLDEALAFVERLRNSESASDVRVYRMQPIPIEFRTYYKVELRPGESKGEEHADARDDVPASQPAAVASPNGDAEGSDSGSRRLFARG